MRGNDHDNPANCDSIAELIPDYAFGLTDSAETHWIESNLARCPDAARQLADYQRMQDALRVDGVPQVEPSAALEARLMAAIEAVPVPTSRKAAQRAARRWHTRTILAVAATLLLVFSNVFWIIQNQQSRADQQALAGKLSEQEQILALIGSG
ncbi:MAG: hypothetical protein IT324_01205, partial [Anaerolineae bacterium]|nr:hypothetical protein [Anaerolineae bacterium]